MATGFPMAEFFFFPFYSPSWAASTINNRTIRRMGLVDAAPVHHGPLREAPFEIDVSRTPRGILVTLSVPEVFFLYLMALNEGKPVTRHACN